MPALRTDGETTSLRADFVPFWGFAGSKSFLAVAVKKGFPSPQIVRWNGQLADKGLSGVVLACQNYNCVYELLQLLDGNCFFLLNFKTER